MIRSLSIHQDTAKSTHKELSSYETCFEFFHN